MAVVAEWQVDFYRRPVRTDRGEVAWELVICERESAVSVFVPQSQANSTWVAAQFRQATERFGWPERILVFRPQVVELLQAACQSMEESPIVVRPTRHVPELKAHLQARSRHYPDLSGYTGQSYDPLDVEPAPPQPLPESVRGNRWQFSALTRENLEGFLERTIPFVGGVDVSQLKELPAETSIPGMTMYGGRRSLLLARWCDRAEPYALRYVPGDPDGMVLDAGLSDRWILATFADDEVAIAARKYEGRRQTSQGWHFVLVLPDDSGATATGIWVMQKAIPFSESSRYVG